VAELEEASQTLIDSLSGGKPETSDRDA
jgi:hypothetical protein